MLPVPAGSLLLVVVAVSLAGAFPNGAPPEACIRGMTPNHGGAISLDPQTLPFLVLRETFPGGIKVTIKSAAEGALMKGFLVQARDPLTGQSARDLGAWLPAEGVKGLPECAAATHSDRNRKTGVVLTWQGSEDVRVFATVLESYSRFWTGVEAVEGAGPVAPGPSVPPTAAALPFGPSPTGAALQALTTGPSPFNSPFFTQNAFGKKK